jgi:hypothetical protein
MRRRHLAIFTTAIVTAFSVSGCVTQQPVAANSSSKKEYVSEETATTGSHIPRRYAVGDTAANANNVSGANASDVQRPQLGRGGN